MTDQTAKATPRGGRPKSGQGAKSGQGTRPRTMSRRAAARLAAVQALYQMEMTAAPVEAIIRDFQESRMEASTDVEAGLPVDPDKSFFARILRGVAFEDDLDAMIGHALTEDWTVERLETVLRAIMRAGTFELLRHSDVPAQVVISEYVLVSKAFFDGKEPGLVNAVLDRVAQTLREDEMKRGRNQDSTDQSRDED